MMKINTSFSREADETLVVDAQHIVDSMTDNAQRLSPHWKKYKQHLRPTPQHLRWR